MVNEEEVRAKLGLDYSMVGEGMSKAKGIMVNAAKDITSSLASAFKNFAGPGLALGALEMFKGMFDTAEQIKRVADATGLSAETYQRLAYTFRETGGRAEDAEKAMQHFADTIGEAREGAEGAVKIMQRWGITLDDDNGFAKTTEQLLDEIAKQMTNQIDPTKAAAEAHDLFGRAVTKSVEAMAAWNEEHGKGAPILDQPTLDLIHEANMEMFWLSEHAKSIGAKALLGTTDFLSFGFYGLTKTHQMIKEHGEWLQQMQDIDDKAIANLGEQGVYVTKLTEDIAKQTITMGENAANNQTFHEATMRNYAEQVEAERRLQEEKDRTAKRDEIHHEQEQLFSMRKDVSEHDYRYHSIDELAQIGINTPAFNIAREIEARRRLEHNFYFGVGTEAAKQNESVIATLTQQLETAGFIQPRVTMDKMESHLEELVKQAQSEDGLNVNMPNNP